MKITKKEAIQIAANFLSSIIKERFEIVDHISGSFYMPGNINLKNCWIIHVQKEELILDGQNQYIIIDKNTGVMNEIIVL